MICFSLVLAGARPCSASVSVGVSNVGNGPGLQVRCGTFIFIDSTGFVTSLSILLVVTTAVAYLGLSAGF